MPSHRSSLSDSRGSTLRRRLRSALLYGDERGSGRSALAGPLALLGVGSFFAVAVATGQSNAAEAALKPAAAVSTPKPESPTVTAAEAVTLPGASRFLRALMVPTPHRARHASRSQHRAPLHRWVRPDIGPLSSPFGYRWAPCIPATTLPAPTAARSWPPPTGASRRRPTTAATATASLCATGMARRRSTDTC